MNLKHFTKLSSAGIALPDDADRGDVAGIRVNSSGLVISTTMPNGGEPLPWKKARAGANKIKFGEHQCRAAEIEELFPIFNRKLYNPAMDPEFLWFLVDAYGDGTNYLLWSNTASAAYPESHAWYVTLSGGGANIWAQSNDGLALSVCGPFPSPGQ